MNILTLLNSAVALGRLAGQPVRAATGFKLKDIVKQVNANLENYNETRLALCEKYGVANGDNYDIAPENQEEFTKEITELVETEVNINFETISPFSLGDAQVSATDLEVLDWLFNKPEPVEYKPLELVKETTA